MSARCKLCNLPTSNPWFDMCPQCIADRLPSGPPWPPPVDPAGPASAAARAVAALNATGGDPEGSHGDADEAVHRFLYEAGFADVAKAYEASRERAGGWWYA